jgi:hypothetical protein
MADPTGPFEWRPRDGDNDILRKILNWFAALGAGTKSIAVNISSAVALLVYGTVTGVGYAASFTQTRPNDTAPYTALDVVGESPAENLEFAGIGPEAEGAVNGKVVITHVALRMDRNSVPAGMTQFRLHLFNAAPTAIADNAAFNLIAADRAAYQGYIEIPTPLDLGDTIYNDTEGGYYPVRKEVTVNSMGNLYGVLQTVGAYTPAAQTTFNVALKAVSI